jgi:hypothetical protein
MNLGVWKPLSKEDGNMLRIFERRILRMIYGQINDNCMWRARYNNELYTVYDKLDTVKSVTNRKIEVAGTALGNARTG